MRAGQLRHRLRIQAPSNTQDDYGEVSKSFSTATTVWARIEPAAGREGEESNRVATNRRAQITIRYHDGLDSTYRLQWIEGDSVIATYQVVSVVNEEARDRTITIDAVEVD